MRHYTIVSLKNCQTRGPSVRICILYACKFLSSIDSENVFGTVHTRNRELTPSFVSPILRVTCSEPETQCYSFDLVFNKLVCNLDVTSVGMDIKPQADPKNPQAPYEKKDPNAAYFKMAPWV